MTNSKLTTFWTPTLSQTLLQTGSQTDSIFPRYKNIFLKPKSLVELLISNYNRITIMNLEPFGV
ncbi:hypothetical protein OIU78_009815 [Salix suchowensis]|nr:hypothetical protein OIU78_009815 [Salix suchowensis]